MRRAISATGLSQLDSTYYNNALSIPLLLPCVYFFREVPNVILRSRLQAQFSYFYTFHLTISPTATHGV